MKYDDDDDITDPKENPVSAGHLPGSGEIGGPVSYNHDPTTYDTSDDPGDETLSG